MGQHADHRTASPTRDDRLSHRAVITLEEVIDPATGDVIFVDPDAEARAEARVPATRTAASLAMTEDGLVEEGRPAQAVQLPNERFSGDEPIDWAAAEAHQAGGQVVSMVDGQIVFGEPGNSAQQVSLPTDRFAAAPALQAESAEVLQLARAGGSTVIKMIKHTSQIPNWPSASPTGWVYTTTPTSHGDELTVLLSYNPSTSLYHARFWRFDVRGPAGQVGSVDLPKYLDSHPNLTAHGTHLYPDGRGGAVLCLSTNTTGGLPTLTRAVLQAAKWADGMGEVVRGRRFPYKE
ncbi:hypothetical protein RB608_10290 [Nocardioides sp. LHD-245]|uniref:hypothetical protein n=1 Tax=Nocardioides sp. LHD-245 TaxID=3051387 RepID=UPI0027E1FBAE|nr:hypothetical protein [Nocardioides sp. LHD-245]